MEVLNNSTWKEFLSSPVSVLILSKTDCQLCDKWFSELEAYEIPENVRLGKLLLDSPGLAQFKIENEWVSNIDILPFNAIYVDGIVKKQWAGGGMERLQTRLNRFL
ncbi:MAG: hypothetical protein ACJZ2K_04205 [Candidatus Poseidoniaceae archaeon]